MQGRLRKFMPRSTRYVLKPHDRTTMRFSLERESGEGAIEETLLLNLSETGVAFLVNAGTEPSVGESIKVEIPIPNDEQIAWWGRVVRIESHHEDPWFFHNPKFGGQSKVVVGVRFNELPDAHTRAIRRGIQKSFLRVVREQEYRSWAYYRALTWRWIFQVTFYIVITALAVGFIYWFSLPTANYDAKRGSPWGERFKF